MGAGRSALRGSGTGSGVYTVGINLSVRKGASRRLEGVSGVAGVLLGVSAVGVLEADVGASVGAVSTGAVSTGSVLEAEVITAGGVADVVEVGSDVGAEGVGAEGVGAEGGIGVSTALEVTGDCAVSFVSFFVSVGISVGRARLRKLARAFIIARLASRLLGLLLLAFC